MPPSITDRAPSRRRRPTLELKRGGVGTRRNNEVQRARRFIRTLPNRRQEEGEGAGLQVQFQTRRRIGDGWGQCSCWKHGNKHCFPEVCGCKGRCGKIAEMAKGPAPPTLAPHENPVGVTGAGALIPAGTLDIVSSRPGEGGQAEGGGISDTSDSDINGGGTTLEDWFEDRL